MHTRLDFDVRDERPPCTPNSATERPFALYALHRSPSRRRDSPDSSSTLCSSSLASPIVTATTHAGDLQLPAPGLDATQIRTSDVTLCDLPLPPGHVKNVILLSLPGADREFVIEKLLNTTRDQEGADGEHLKGESHNLNSPLRTERLGAQLYYTLSPAVGEERCFVWDLSDTVDSAMSHSESEAIFSLRELIYDLEGEIPLVVLCVPHSLVHSDVPNPRLLKMRNILRASTRTPFSSDGCLAKQQQQRPQVLFKPIVAPRLALVVTSYPKHTNDTKTGLIWWHRESARLHEQHLVLGFDEYIPMLGHRHIKHHQGLDAPRGLRCAGKKLVAFSRVQWRSRARSGSNSGAPPLDAKADCEAKAKEVSSRPSCRRREVDGKPDIVHLEKSRGDSSSVKLPKITSRRRILEAAREFAVRFSRSKSARRSENPSSQRTIGESRKSLDEYLAVSRRNHETFMTRLRL